MACDENILDPMADRQPRVHQYAESAFFADGLAMHAPPEGTVPRERITMKPALTTGREGETGRSPPTASAAVVRTPSRCR